MKKIKLIPIEIDDDFVDYGDDLDAGEGKSWNFEFDLNPYLMTCALACGMLFVTRFVQKHFLRR